MQGKIDQVPELQSLAAKYKKDAAQIVLRWDLQKGVVTIPKSIHTERIISNTQIFDFVLSDEDVKLIDHLDKHQRLGPDPDTFDF